MGHGAGSLGAVISFSMLLVVSGCESTPRSEGPKSAPEPTGVFPSAPVPVAPVATEDAPHAVFSGVVALHLADANSKKTADVTDPSDVAAFLSAVGLKSTPTDGCLRCMPTVTFAVEGAGGAKLGQVAIACGPNDDLTQASYVDAAGKCASFKPADGRALKSVATKYGLLQ